MNNKSIVYLGLAAFIIAFFLIIWASLSVGEKAIKETKKAKPEIPADLLR
jgi:hypothetical protein